MDQRETKEPQPSFGLSPRTVSGRAKRAVRNRDYNPWYPLFFLCFFGAFYLFTSGMPFLTADKACLRYSIWPDRWEPAGEGLIVSAEGRVFVIEQTLPDGRTIQFQHPDGRFPFWRFNMSFPASPLKAGQMVPLLRYVNDPDCMIFAFPKTHVHPMPLYAIVILCTVLPALLALLVVGCIAGMKQRRVNRHIIHLLETAPFGRFCLKNKRGNRKVLEPVDDDTLAPIPLEKEGRLTVGQKVGIFVDEAEPEKSFMMETLWAKLVFDPETNQVDCRTVWPYRLINVTFGIALLAIGSMVLRLVLIY